ncbi:MAG: MMPL family transporter [Myxococcales bacterium]|nr:MMPL family transporter [Myxococcales bacterium]
MTQALRFSKAVGAGLGRLAAWSGRHPKSVLALALISAVAAGNEARTLKIQADLVGLLPETFESVQNVNRFQDTFGEIGYVVVVASGADNATLKRFADALAPRLERLPEVRYVDLKQPTSFLQDRALYYVALDKLAKLHDQVEDRAIWEKRKANPLYVDVEDTEAPKVDIEGWLKEVQGDQRSSDRARTAYYLDAKAHRIGVFAKPKGKGLDLGAAKKVVTAVRSETEKVVADFPGVTFELGGGATKKVDQQRMIEDDLRVSTFVALALVLLYLGFHFRRIAAIVLILVPLLVGVVWSFGFAALMFGVLNILTAFIGAMLLGLGIDHGIHLLGHYQVERARTADLFEALESAFTATGVGAVTATITTMVGFFGLGFSEMRAFREFGIIAGTAMFLLLFAYITVLPALLALAEGWGWRPSTAGEDAQPHLLLRLIRRPGLVGVVVTVVSGISIYGLTHLEFDFNFRNLVASQETSFRLDAVIDGLLGYSQAPVAVLTHGVEDEAAVTKALRDHIASVDGASTIDLVASTQDLVPPQQEEKQELLQDMQRDIDNLDESQLPEAHRDRLPEVKRMVRAEPFGYDDLPIELKRRFMTLSGKRGSFVLVYPAVDLSHGARAADFAAEVRSVKTGTTSVAAAGGPMVMADVFNMVVREAPPTLGLTILLVLIVTWLLVGRLQAALLVLGPALMTLLFTLGLLPFTSIPLNYLNVVIIPVLFGLSVDGGAHLVTRTHMGGEFDDLVREVGRGVAGSILTTALGFGALLSADHLGLRSFASLALFGLANNIVAALVVTPTLLLWSMRRTARRASR